MSLVLSSTTVWSKRTPGPPTIQSMRPELGLAALQPRPIAEKNVSDTGVDVSPHLEVLKTSEPPGRKGGVKVKDVADLVSKLKNEAGVL